MVIDPKETVIAYRCDKCGKTTASIVGVFSLSGDLIKLKCDCKESELILTYTNDKKINIKVPCLFCGETHNFNVSLSGFMEKEVITLTCPYVGLEICYLGKKDPVFTQLEKDDEELNRIFKEYSLADITNGKNNSLSDDKTAITDIINFILCELEDENKIFCGCEDKGEYKFILDDDGVCIICTKCGKKKHFHISSVNHANEFLNLDSLTLE